MALASVCPSPPMVGLSGAMGDSWRLDAGGLAFAHLSHKKVAVEGFGEVGVEPVARHLSNSRFMAWGHLPTRRVSGADRER